MFSRSKPVFFLFVFTDEAEMVRIHKELVYQFRQDENWLIHSAVYRVMANLWNILFYCFIYLPHIVIRHVKWEVYLNSKFVSRVLEYVRLRAVSLCFRKLRNSLESSSESPLLYICNANSKTVQLKVLSNHSPYMFHDFKFMVSKTILE